MKVILLQDIRGVGRAREIKNVSDGYAKNFLLPRKLARVATEGAVKESVARKIEEESEASEMKKRFDALREETLKTPIEVYVKTGPSGEIFSGIHNKDIDDALVRRGVKDAKTELKKPIKELGSRKVRINFGRGAVGEITIEIKPKTD